MDDSLISPRFKDRIANVDGKLAFELFYKHFEKTNNFQESFNQVADQLKITSSEIQYLYHKEDWALKIVKNEAELAIVEQMMAKKTWMKDSQNLYSLGQTVIAQLLEDYEKEGKLPFDVEVIRKDPRLFEKFVKTMETLANIKLTTDDNITKSIIINQHHQTHIDSISGVDNDKINDILNREGLIQDGEFNIKNNKKRDEEK